MFRFVLFSLCASSIWALPYSTGQSKVAPYKLPGPRIINGESAKEGQFPWQVGIFIQATTGFFFCGGSIISEEWILTAGHCVLNAQTGQVVSGTLDAYNGSVTNISQFILHAEYDDYSSANDIGLAKLVTPLQFDENTAAIQLATEVLPVESEFTISGWGLTSDDGGVITNSLNYVELVTIENRDCDQYYAPGAVLDEMVCAESPTSEVKGICSGDSGSPAVVDLNTTPVQVALASFVSIQGCESGVPSGYIRTAYYRDWIKENTGV